MFEYILQIAPLYDSRWAKNIRRISFFVKGYKCLLVNIWGPNHQMTKNENSSTQPNYEKYPVKYKYCIIWTFGVHRLLGEKIRDRLPFLEALVRLLFLPVLWVLHFYFRSTKFLVINSPEAKNRSSFPFWRLAVRRKPYCADRKRVPRDILCFRYKLIFCGELAGDFVRFRFILSPSSCRCLLRIFKKVFSAFNIYPQF